MRDTDHQRSLERNRNTVRTRDARSSSPRRPPKCCACCAGFPTPSAVLPDDGRAAHPRRAHGRAPRGRARTAHRIAPVASARLRNANVSVVHEHAEDTVREKQRQIDALAPWFHNLHLPGGAANAAAPFPRRRFPELQVAADRALAAARSLGLARPRRRLQRGLLQLPTRAARRVGARHRRRAALPRTGRVGTRRAWTRGNRRVPLHGGLRHRALERTLRPGLVHGRLLPLALPAARARPARRAHAPPDDVPDADDAGRDGVRRHAPIARSATGRGCSTRAGRRWRSSSIGWPAIRPTGGRPTTPASRRCCARAA